MTTNHKLLMPASQRPISAPVLRLLPTVLRSPSSVLCLLTSVLCLPPSVHAQAPGYSKEEVTARENVVREEGILVRAQTSQVAGEMLMSGSRSIGSARSKVRSGGDSQSAMLRYDQHREVTPPRYTTLRIGPFYSDLGISQSVGYRLISMSGSGVDFLTGSGRGEFRKDGSDFPLVSSISFNNYLLISRHMDLEANVNVSYAHYPLGTQEDEFRIDLSDEGVYGTLSSEFTPSRDTKLLVYDDILYRTDYIDTRGLSDRYGGDEYEHFQNTVGADWDWKPSPFDNVSLSASRVDEIPLDDEFESQERVGYSEAISYQRELTQFALAGLLGSFTQSLYEEDSRPDVYMYGLSSFASAKLTRRLTGNGSLGYQFSTYDGGDFEGGNRGSLTMGFGLGHQISEEKSQKLSYSRAQAEAFSGGVDINQALTYGLFWRGGLFPGAVSTALSSYDPQDSGRNGYSSWLSELTLNHQLTRLLKLSLSTSYDMRMNDAGGAIDPDTPDISSDYETWRIRLGSRMPLSKKTSLDVYAEHVDRTSDSEDLTYTRDVIAATLTWAHKF